jgi:hypothetical protein
MKWWRLAPRGAPSRAAGTEGRTLDAEGNVVQNAEPLTDPI